MGAGSPNLNRIFANLPLGLVLSYALGFFFPESQISFVVSAIFLFFISRNSRFKLKIYFSAAWFLSAIVVAQCLRIASQGSVQLLSVLIGDLIAIGFEGLFVLYLAIKKKEAKNPNLSLSSSPSEHPSVSSQTDSHLALKLLSRATEFMATGRSQIVMMEEASHDLMDQQSRLQEMIEVLQKISTQAKLLAMNAHIEASRMEDSTGVNLPGIIYEMEQAAEIWEENVSRVQKNLSDFSEKIQMNNRLCHQANSLFLTLDQEVGSLQHKVAQCENLSLLNYQSSQNGF